MRLTLALLGTSGDALSCVLDGCDHVVAACADAVLVVVMLPDISTAKLGVRECLLATPLEDLDAR